MTPEEFRLTEILFRHPELHGKTLEEIVGSEKKIMDKRAEAYKRLRESEERLFPGFLETIDEKSIKPASLDEIKEHHGRSRWGIYGYQFKRYCEKDKEFRSAERAYKGILDQATSGILLDESSRGYDVWKRKAVAFKPNSNFDSPDDIIRHNLAIHLRAVNSDKIFYYRLYKYNALDWHGELHSKGTKILKNISELRNILEKET